MEDDAGFNCDNDDDVVGDRNTRKRFVYYVIMKYPT